MNRLPGNFYVIRLRIRGNHLVLNCLDMQHDDRHNNRTHLLASFSQGEI